MSGWLWIVIVVAVLVLIAVVAWRALASRRTRSLQDRFGPEYERAAETAGSRRQAEAELAAREERREQLTIRPLPTEARRRYASQWQVVQVQFVDSPVAAVSSADALVTTVMTDRGYPLDDFEQRAADVSSTIRSWSGTIAGPARSRVCRRTAGRRRKSCARR